MMPILFAPTETAFDTNGIGILGETVDCTVIRELNGQDELELQYPMDGMHFSSIDFRSIILTEPAPGKDPQPYRVYHKSNPTKSGVVTFYARHVAYDTKGITVSPFVAHSCAEACHALKTNATTYCIFVFETDIDTSAEMIVKVPTPIWTLLGDSDGSILKTYGGEREFDRWKITIRNRVGADRGVSIRYGKNLTTLEQDANCANCYTGVHPYWMGSDGTLVELPEKILHAEGKYGYTRIMVLDLSKEWTEKPTEDQIRERARKYMVDNDIGTPVVSWKIDFVQLAQTEEYKHSAIQEQVYLGDTVSAVFQKMQLDVSARVVSTRYKPILGRYENVTLGSIRPNIVDTIARQQQNEKKQTADLKGYANTTAQQAVNAQTADDILSRLTNGGTVKGLYQMDNKWYIDASLVNILNLIAETVKSVSGDTEMSISQAILKMMHAGNETARLYHDGDMPIFALMNIDSSNRAQLTPSSMKLGGTSDAPVFELDVSSGCRLRIPENGAAGTIRTISWKSNGDGTYNLVGQ